MKKIILLLFVAVLAGCGQFVAVLAGCGQSEPAATETVESLAADPVRLKELRQQCKLDRAELGDALCNRVSEATRKRFYGDGNVPYTPSENPPTF